MFFRPAVCACVSSFVSLRDIYVDVRVRACGVVQTNLVIIAVGWKAKKKQAWFLIEHRACICLACGVCEGSPSTEELVHFLIK